jgi:hypothetical protein
MKLPTLAFAVFAVLGQVHLATAQPPQRALEISAQTGYGHVWGKNGDRSHEIESRNGGVSFAVGIAYRTPYLFVPWAEGGWAALQSSRETSKSREFSSEGPSTSSLATAYLLLGPGVEASVFRFRSGIGIYRQEVTSRFAGQNMAATSWDMGYFLAYGVRVHDGPRFGWGMEAMALLMSESQLAYLGIAVRVWGNAWSEPR